MDFNILQKHYIKVLANSIKKAGGPICTSLDEVIDNILYLGEKTEESSYISLKNKKIIAFLLSPTNRL